MYKKLKIIIILSNGSRIVQRFILKSPTIYQINMKEVQGSAFLTGLFFRGFDVGIYIVYHLLFVRLDISSK